MGSGVFVHTFALAFKSQPIQGGGASARDPREGSTQAEVREDDDK